MTRHDDLPRMPHAFEVDPSWYQSHWYQPPRPAARKSATLLLRLMACFAVFCAGAYLVG